MIPTVQLGKRKMFIAVVPVDDENCLRFTMTERLPDSGSSAGAPNEIVDGLPVGYHSDSSRNTSDWLGRFQLAGNRRNDYLIDREIQRANRGPLGYSGIPGRGQDQAVTESMGVIYQRDREHLGVTDAGIIRMRRLLLRATRALRDHGTTPPGVDRPELYRVRSGAIILPNGVNGVLATQDLQWAGLEGRAPMIEARV
jgi:phthalate 4,5-dioxygenase oxygenase subunit